MDLTSTLFFLQYIPKEHHLERMVGLFQSSPLEGAMMHKLGLGVAGLRKIATGLEVVSKVPGP